MSFWPTTTGAWAFSTTLVITALILRSLWPKLHPAPLSTDDRRKVGVEKLVEWERDRVMTLAKGVAGTAAAYFGSLIPLVFKGEISMHVSGLAATGTVVGFFGALLLAGDIAASTTIFIKNYLP